MQPNSGFAIVPAPKKSLEDIYRVALGFVSWNMHLLAASGSNTAPTAGTIYATSVPYRAGQIVTNVCWDVPTAGSGTAPTSIFCGVSDLTTVRAVSADVKASAQWTAVGIAQIAMQAAYTIPADGIYYHLLLQVGSWGTTQMALSRGNGFAAALGSNFFAATGGTSQTVLPAVGAAITLANTAAPLLYYAAST